MATLTVMTRLEAINIMLRAIGEAPVSTLNVTDLLDVANANATLETVSREVQSIGWKFNTRYNWPLAKDVDGHIDAPADALKVYAMPGYEASQDFALEGFRLFDRRNNTDVWTVSPIKVKIVFYRDFETLPQAARSYITIRAARRFQLESLGSSTLMQYSEEQELRARAEMIDAESETQDANILTGSWDMAKVLLYRRP